MIFCTKQTIALTQLLTLEMEAFYIRTKLKKSKEVIFFFTSDTFVSFFGCDTDILYK